MSREALSHLVRIFVPQDQTPDESAPIPKLGSAAALQDWLRRIETDLEGEDIPQSQWSTTAMLFLNNSVKFEMRKLKQRRIEMGLYTWPWNEFTESPREVLNRKGATAYSGVTTATATTGIKGVTTPETELFITGFVVLGSAVFAGALFMARIIPGDAAGGLLSLFQAYGQTVVGATAETAAPGLTAKAKLTIARVSLLGPALFSAGTSAPGGAIATFIFIAGIQWGFCLGISKLFSPVQSIGHPAIVHPLGAAPAAGDGRSEQSASEVQDGADHPLAS
ncbi:hypothetical protein GALMADRAFT_211884 [Galerina marginata CBS 339.88]|uniref:Uncharacterized protein n=1 Tax=Galerina marginata (strain CBS 339.88) TaxID=685588 RepID=A0A067STP8_GALM3|nr:hypothetical protein GALMADRAFT_211884 [Galerina marginata CBS 339.88]